MNLEEDISIQSIHLGGEINFFEKKGSLYKKVHNSRLKINVNFL